MAALKLLLILLFVIPAPLVAGPIYVYKERDGVIRFTNKPPPEGINAKVFTAKEGSFSWYRIGTPGSKRKQFWSIQPNRYKDLIENAAEITGVDRSLIRAVIHVESGFNPRAVSSKGARGLMQLIPDTARLVGVKNIFDPQENVLGGAKYLKYLLKEFKGNTAFALAGYNAGPQRVKDYKGIPPFVETKEYVRAVLILKDKYAQTMHQ